MLFAVIIHTLIFCGYATNALLVRDANGDWRSFTWVKRSGPGDVLQLSLTNSNDKSYSVPVRMGTPFQEIQMAVSLSQNFIAVASPNANGDAGFYNPSASSSNVPGTATSSLSGSSGSTTTATFADEHCQISDFNYNASIAITPPSANANKDLYPDGVHGVLGYGLDTPSGAPADSALLSSYLPPASMLKGMTAVCGIELNWAGDANQGLFTMGGLDSTAFTGNFSKLLVPNAKTVERPSWSVPSDGIFALLGGGTQAIAGSLSSIDPYYPRIGLPADAVKLLYSKIQNAAPSPSNPNRYTVPCDEQIKITIKFGGKNFTMDPRDAISREDGQCFGTVEITNSKFYQIGSPFLRNVYTEFGADFDANANPTLFVGFADKVLRPGSKACKRHDHPC